MSRQIKLRDGNSLDAADTVANIATNKADIAPAPNVDGQDIYPRNVTTEHLFASDGIFNGYLKAGSLFVGSGGVTISSSEAGATPNTGLLLSASTLQLIKSGVATVTLDGTTGDATFTGTITAGGTFTGSMTAGSIIVGSGGVTITSDAGGGTPSTGIILSTSSLQLRKAGVPTITLDGTTGVVTAASIVLTTDAASTVNMSLGSITIGGTASVGGTTASALIQTFYQSSAPTASHTGDMWVDSDDLRVYRWNGSNWTTQTVANLNTTFAQDAIPTSLNTGDFWVDTNDGNKLYRAASIGANEIKAGEWVAVIDAINAGGYVTVDASNNITNIDTTGITVGTATSGARVQINSTGMGVYNSSNVLKTVVSADGLALYNAAGTSPTAPEKISFMTGTTEEGYIYYDHTSAGDAQTLYVTSVAHASGTNSASLKLNENVSGLYNSHTGGLIEINSVGTVTVTCDGGNIGINPTGGRLTVNAVPFHETWTSYSGEASILTCEAGFALSNITITRAVYAIIGPMCFYEVLASFQTGSCSAGDNDIYIKVPAAYTIANSFCCGTGNYVANAGVRTAGFTDYHDTTHILFRKYDASDWSDTASANNNIHASGFFTWAAA